MPYLDDESEANIRRAIVEYLASREEEGVKIDDEYTKSIVPYLMEKMREKAIADRRKKNKKKDEEDDRNAI